MTCPRCHIPMRLALEACWYCYECRVYYDMRPLG